jgi:hypothetical protein
MQRWTDKASMALFFPRTLDPMNLAFICPVLVLVLTGRNRLPLSWIRILNSAVDYLLPAI